MYNSQGGVYSKMAQLMNTYDSTTGKYLVENTEAGRKAYLRQAEMRNTDWFQELFRPTVQHSHSVSITSGSEKGSYYASLGALVDPGWSIQSKVNRYTALFNTSQKLFNDHITLNIIGNASYRQQRAPGSLASSTNLVEGSVKRDFDINPYSYALRTSRTLDPDEFYTRNYAPFNIRHELENNYIDLSVLDTKFQAEIKAKPIKGLELSALGSVRYQLSMTEHNIKDNSNQAEAYRAAATKIIKNANPYLYKDPDNPTADKYTVLPQGGILKKNDYSALSMDFRASGTYNTAIAEKHIINAFAAMEVNSLDRHASSFDGWGLQYEAGETPFYILDLFKKQLEQNTYYYSLNNTHERNVAFATTASYSYNYRYTINGTFRYEGSNRLGRARSALVAYMECRRQVVCGSGRVVRCVETCIVQHELPRILFIDSGQGAGLGEQLYGIVLSGHSVASFDQHQGTVTLPVFHREL